MNRLSYLLALSVGLVTVTGIDAIATVQSIPMAPAFDSTHDVLLANRLRNRRMRFRVRSSRFRRGGFSRGCPAGAAPVVPVAEDATDTNMAPGYTTATTHPTFFINVPEMTGATGFIFIEDPASTDPNPQLYKAAFELNNTAGIVGIKVPSDAPMLEEGARYRWRVSIRCPQEGEREGTIVFKGGEVERVAGIQGTTEERLDYYLEAGIWQDTAEIIAADRYYNDSIGADEDWAILMESSGIPQFADAPIVAITEGRLSE